MAKYQRKYSDEKKKTALAMLKANAGNLSLTSNELGIPISTLAQWRDGGGVNEDIFSGLQNRQEEIARIIDNTIKRVLNMLDYKAEDADVRELAAAFGTLVDKRQLLVGQPTAIVSQQKQLSEEELFGQLQKLAEILRKRAELEQEKHLVQAIPAPASEQNAPETTGENGGPAPEIQQCSGNGQPSSDKR
jgi:hypothetical protein